MATRKASAKWNGDLKKGKGIIRIGNEEKPYSFASRFEEGEGTNPEELIAAAHAGCFSMALSLGLSEAGHTPESIETEAKVHLEPSGDGFAIPSIELDVNASVPGIDEDTFRKHAQEAKDNCPVSKALAGCEIKLSYSVNS